MMPFIIATPVLMVADASFCFGALLDATIRTMRA
jgi:hypothetical protein